MKNLITQLIGRHFSALQLRYHLIMNRGAADVDYFARDRTTGGYRIAAFFPGLLEEDIQIILNPNEMRILAGDYDKTFILPERVFEIRKTYTNGVIDIRLI